MQPKPHLGVTLTIIYLALVSSCLAIYHLIVKFISDQDQQTMFASLLAWSATLFATIALLYTFKEWRNQKASDVIANRSEKLWDELDKLENIYNYDKLRNLDKIKDWDEFIIYSNTDLKCDFKNSVNKLYKEIQIHIEFIEDHDKNEELIKLLKELKSKLSGIKNLPSFEITFLIETKKKGEIEKILHSIKLKLIKYMLHKENI
jgi:glutaredoxin